MLKNNSNQQKGTALARVDRKRRDLRAGRLAALLPLLLMLSVLPAQEPEALSLASVPDQSPAESREQASYVPGALYVKFADGAVDFAKSAERECPVSRLFSSRSKAVRYGLKPMAYSMHVFDNDFLDNVFRIEFDSVSQTESFIRELEQDPRVVFVEKVPLHQLQWEGGKPGSEGNAPDDYFFGNIDNMPTSWHWDMIGFPETYGYYQGDKSVKVAVVDNAVWGNHEDLQLESANLYDAILGIPGGADPPAYVVQDQQGSATAPSAAYGWSHGTHCAGVIGALTDNGLGVASPSSGVTVLGVRAADANERDMVRAVQGVLWAVDQGADIVSMSYGSSNYSSVEEEVYGELAEKGVILIAAAGNDGKEGSNYPAAYPGVISVGALNSDASRASFSNYGADVDVWAPGGYFVENGEIRPDVQVFSTTYCISQYHADKEAFAGKHYDMMAGTSMATPVVSSVAALLLSVEPGLNGYQMAELLRAPQAGACVRIPDALQRLEAQPDLAVRNLQAYWMAETQGLELSWEAPEQAGVERYDVYRNGQRIGSSEETSFQGTLADTSGFVGVKAVYASDSSLTEYVKLKPKAEGSSLEPLASRKISVRMDPASGLLYLEENLVFDCVEIFAVDGRLARLVRGGQQGVDLSDLPRSVYVGRVWNDSMHCGFFKVLR